MSDAGISYETTTSLSYAQAIERCRTALSAEGFGVLTEIDIKATLKKKLDVDREPYMILGACHPPSAHSALEALPAIGVLLPCNVTVSVEGGKTVVRAMNPQTVMSAVDDPRVAEMASEIGGKLKRVLAALG
jgi:uncharacterized protein (DUF302 family)